jgi:hypothetical protein
MSYEYVSNRPVCHLFSVALFLPYLALGVTPSVPLFLTPSVPLFLLRFFLSDNVNRLARPDGGLLYRRANLVNIDQS